MSTSIHTSPVRSKQAFTLIEMLEVIAILAIFALIFIPAGLSVLEKTRSVRSMSNMKQIGLAATRFSQDHSGSIPSAWDSAKSRSCMQQLHTYGLAYKEYQSYMYCPLMRSKYASVNAGKETSYAMNNHIGDRSGKKSWEGINTIFQRTDSGATAFLFNSFYHSCGTSWKFSATPNSGSDVVIPADGENVYVLFLDGSVRSIPAAEGRLPVGGRRCRWG